MTFDRLLEPISFASFRDDWYEKRPLLIKRQAPGWYADLVTLDDVNHHLGEGHLSSASVRIVRSGKELEPHQFTYPYPSTNSHWARGAVDKNLLFAKYYDGHTIVLKEFERHSAAVLRLRHDMERVFRASVMTHVYLTPRNAQGFTPHWDTHDVFILQFSGTKKWTIYDSPVTLPMSEQPLYPGEWTPVEPTLEATLEPGDLLYVPRGFVHEARTGDAVSGHVTIGLHTKKYADLLRQIAENAHADAWLRKSLPIDLQDVATNDEFLRHVHRFFENADLPAYLGQMQNDFAETRLPDAVDRLDDYVKLPLLDAASRLRMRSIVCHELRDNNGAVVLAFDKKSLTFPAEAADSIRFIIASREFEVGALPGTVESNLAVCGTLVREGFLRIARTES